MDNITPTKPTATSSVDLDDARRAYSPKTNPETIWKNYEYDMQRFLEHSSAHVINQDSVALSSWLVSAFHGVEKGLTMETAKEGFALRKIPPMMAAIRELERTGHASYATRGARGCLQAYVRFNDTHGLKIPDQYEADVRDFVAQMEEETYPGGAIALSRAQIEAATDFDYDAFSQTRCSLRQYTGAPVDPKQLENAVRQAIKSPRSCNREMRRLRVVYDPEMRDHLLSFHSGNRGFGHKLGAVLVISVDLREFDMVGERNQGWIDGGIFAMSLVMALHANRLGSCMLNWSQDCDQDRHLRQAFDIPDHEAIVTFLGVGQMPETFEVAASPSPNVSDVMSLLRPREPRGEAT
jgi:nitroreductase